MTEGERTIAALFRHAGCEAALHAVDLETGVEVAVEADRPVVLASVFKVLVALELFAQAVAGTLDLARRVRIEPATLAAGQTGVSGFRDRAEISLHDLCGLMLTVSDNGATDILVEAVGLERINVRAAACGCRSTLIESDLKTLFDRMGQDLGFSNYDELDAARAGRLGAEAQARTLDAARVDASAAYDPLRTNRSTPRDMTRLLRAIWADDAAAPEACAQVRKIMEMQVSTRLGRALPDGARLAAKTGSLTGRVRNEIGVVTHADGRAFALAVFTRAHRPFERVAEIEAAMAAGGAAAVELLRRARP